MSPWGHNRHGFGLCLACPYFVFVCLWRPQASESGSVDELQSQVLEWQEMVTMVTEAEAARDQAREEKNAMALRMSHIEEEREGKDQRQQG